MHLPCGNAPRPRHVNRRPPKGRYDPAPNRLDLCPDTDVGGAVDADGCPLPPDDGIENDNTDGDANDNAVDNGNDNGAPSPEPTLGECGCGAGGITLLPIAMFAMSGLRRRWGRGDC